MSGEFIGYRKEPSTMVLLIGHGFKMVSKY